MHSILRLGGESVQKPDGCDDHDGNRENSQHSHAHDGERLVESRFHIFYIHIVLRSVVLMTFEINVAGVILLQE